MNLFRSFALGIATLGAILAIISISLPRKIHIQRDIIINAPVEAAYEQISDIRNWPKWLPSRHSQNEVTTATAGAYQGVGDKYNWVSHRRGIRPGVVTIVAAEPHKRLVTNLEFEDQEKVHSIFTLEETKEGTKLTWNLEKYMGDNPFHKFAGLLIDSTVGEEFEDGLENIKREVEAQYLLTDN